MSGFIHEARRAGDSLESALLFPAKIMYRPVGFGSTVSSIKQVDKRSRQRGRTLRFILPFVPSSPPPPQLPTTTTNVPS